MVESVLNDCYMRVLMPAWVCLPFFLFVFSSKSNGQGVQGNLSGKVLDNTNVPVRFATVGIYKWNNTATALWQTLTDSNGHYTLSADTGTYMLKISYAGFNSYSQSIVLKSERTILDDVFLSPSDNRLQAVTVKAHKPLIEQSEDKIIYNAENDPAAKTESATDLLRKTPMITVDGEGNITVNGQSTFTILLNGRQTSMFARNIKEALKAFPGAVISKIEVITSPSAKYDAEGAGGIINIITKKKLMGYNVSLGASYNTLHKHNENATINAKWSKWAFSAYISTGGYTHPLTSYTFNETTAFGDAAFSKRTLSGEVNHSSRSADASLELTYDFDSLNTVAIYGSLDRYRNKDVFVQNIFTESHRQNDEQSQLNRTAVYNGPEEEIGIDLIHKFRNQPGKELSFRYNTQVYKDDDASSSVQTSFAANRFVDNTNWAKSREQTAQLDFVQPVGEKHKIEAGAKAIIRSASSIYQSLVKQESVETFIPDPSNSDRFNYRQDVYSLYVSSTIRQKKNSLRAGLRTEYTVVDGNFISTKTSIHQAYASLVPNLVFSRKFTPLYTLLATYNLRLHRPSITSLNPFVNNSDSLTISFGNPTLEPQILHALSLQNRFSSGKFFAAANLNASYSNNLIVQYASFNPETGITSITKANVGKEWQASIAINIATPLGDKLDVSLVSQLRYNKLLNGADRLQRAEGVSGSLSGNIRYKVAEDFVISSSGGLSRSPYALVNSPSAQYYYQINFRQKLLSDKLALSVNVNNFFDRYYGYKTVTKSPDFRMLSINTNPFRAIYFGMTYNFGKLKDDVSKKKGVSNDDREQR